jgi:hypothetical protein
MEREPEPQQEFCRDLHWPSQIVSDLMPLGSTNRDRREFKVPPLIFLPGSYDRNAPSATKIVEAMVAMADVP